MDNKTKSKSAGEPTCDSKHQQERAAKACNCSPEIASRCVVPVRAKASLISGSIPSRWPRSSADGERCDRGIESLEEPRGSTTGFGLSIPLRRNRCRLDCARSFEGR